MNLVVVGDPSRKPAHDRCGVNARTDPEVVALDCAHEGFGHAVALWAFHECGSRLEAVRLVFRFAGPLPNFRPRYNVAPTQRVPIVRAALPSAGCHASLPDDCDPAI